MPDKRVHRGPHPEDAESFGPSAWPQLREAVGDLSWLLSRGYADKSALKLVGDRFALIQRQRIAVARCACSDFALARRRKHEVPPAELAGKALLLDGYNVLTTIEAALAGGVIIQGRDGCYRDMASMHGTFRAVQETGPAIRMLGDLLAQLGVGRGRWYLDSPVSNSGRLREMIRAIAAERAWNWQVELVTNPDPLLASAGDIVATADSVILDHCDRWFNLARAAVTRALPDVSVVNLSPRAP